ncbi:MAG: DUF4738 domain-containing protein [Prevotella sp.]|nr:DUF4738 domain-containing protein [Prevotella sp.]
MRKSLHAILLLMLLVSAGACKKKSEAPISIIVPKPAAPAPVGIQSIGDEAQPRQTIKWGGGTYTLGIKRWADKELPVVDDGDGGKYYDNRISVDILDGSGNTFFSRKYSKNDFANYLERDMLGRSVLYNIVFYETSDQALFLVASVGSPDDTGGDFVQMEIRIARDGSSSVRKTAIREIEEF